jgi:hypothetical protein
VIANKNKTAMAPAKITAKSNAKNSHSIINNKHAENKKLPTKNKRENTQGAGQQ